MTPQDIAITMIRGVGARTVAHLLRHFGSAQRVLSATPSELVAVAGLNPRLAAEVAANRATGPAAEEMRYCDRHAITPIASTDPHYPRLLGECDDYPHVIYYKGDPAALSGRLLSVVGTRKMTAYGQRVCTDIISGLAAMFPDLVVVSGLAFGVDGAAHRAALSAGVRTIGVLADQLPAIYPAAHASLAEEMMRRGGGVLTEQNSLNKSKGVNFVSRNRIIAGMSAGTLVVESPHKGGSLITAAMADGYHRGVMAVPGRVGDTYSGGTNFLIATNRASLVASAEDVARELGWDAPAQKAASRGYSESTAGTAAMRLLAQMPESEAVNIDELALRVGLSVAEMAPLLLELEFDGAIRMLPGKIYERA